ncbi:MAG: prepilin peptidase [Planctomycetota bacterium]|jgi:prepilin signal peptidase PulO-like enzyme (type II secretory pathway)
MFDLQITTTGLILVHKGFAAGLLATAAVTDLARRRIYCLWSAIALVSGLVLVGLTGQWQHLIAALSLFGLTYVLWSGGGIGGGDVWLAIYLGLALGLDAFLAILLGSVIGLAVSALLIIRGTLTWRDTVPLGLYWALGGLVILVTGWRIWPG